MSLEPLTPGSPAYVRAGRRVRCNRCGKIHALVRSDDPDDDSGELYIECCGHLLPAAHKHWFTGSESDDEDHEIQLP